MSDENTGSGAAVDAAPAPAKLAAGHSAIYQATGRRKTSIAKVLMTVPGTGVITVNGRELDQIYARHLLNQHIREPLKVTGMDRQVDVSATTSGGGVTGQAGAVRLGIARALLKLSAENRGVLRKVGSLTRDPRAKERRKYGLKKARKAAQYSKR